MYVLVVSAVSCSSNIVDIIQPSTVLCVNIQITEYGGRKIEVIYENGSKKIIGIELYI